MPLISIDDSLESQRTLPVRSSRQQSWGKSLTVDLYPRDPAFFHDPLPRDHHIIVMFTAGTGLLEQARGCKSYKSQVRSGDILIVPSGQKASWRGAVPQHLRMRMPVHQLDAAWIAVGALPSRQAELTPVYRTRDPMLAQLAMLFSSELSASDHPTQSLIAEAASAMVASHLVRTYCTFGGGKPPDSHDGLSAHMVNRITEYVQAHLAGVIRLQDLACIAGLTPFHFARVFKASTGLTPMRFVDCARMERAKVFLREDRRRTIQEAARMVGFSNQSHFTRRFSAHHHQTPSELRRSPV